MVRTIATFANMTVANIPVNLAWAMEREPVSTRHVLLLALGPDMHAHALLLRKAEASA